MNASDASSVGENDSPSQVTALDGSMNASDAHAHADHPSRRGQNTGILADGGDPDSGVSTRPDRPASPSDAGPNMSSPDSGDAQPHTQRCGNGKIEGAELCDGDCPTIADCKTSQACLTPVLLGGAATCDARCDVSQISTCVSGDGCCPLGCMYPDDDDCSRSCGDGVIDPPERCEPNHPVAPCPTTCDDGVACTSDVLSGDPAQCSAECTYVQVMAAKSGDGCCPSGANANNDDDCMPICGNGVVEEGEDCDGNCPTSCPRPRGSSCAIAEPSGAGCNVVCLERMLTASVARADGCCPEGANANTDRDCEPECGNGATEPGETCDADCPTQCPDAPGDCARGERQGSPCNYRCVETEIAASLGAADGCCPDGATSSTDSDCEPECGNGVLDPGENCEISGAAAYDRGTCDTTSCTLLDGAYGPCSDAMQMPACPVNSSSWFCAPIGECSRFCTSDSECRTTSGRGFCLKTNGTGYCAIDCSSCPFGHRCVNFDDVAMICGSVNWTAERGPH